MGSGIGESQADRCDDLSVPNLRGYPVLTGELNANTMLLNVRNGTIDLRTGKLRPHDPKDLITKMCPVAFDPNARCPRWERFENEVFLGDRDLIGYMRRKLGYALTADDSIQEIDILHGDGSNGKNVLVDTVYRILGDYACIADDGLLMAKRFEDHPTGLADLDGRRFVVASETGDGRRLAESLVKKLTGNGIIKARRMRQDFYEFKRTFKIFLATNHPARDPRHRLRHLAAHPACSLPSQVRQPGGGSPGPAPEAGQSRGARPGPRGGGSPWHPGPAGARLPAMAARGDESAVRGSGRD